VCFVFLFHLRSAFVAIISLPLGILAAFIVMYYQGVNANIMSLGGIAIAIGAMVDAAVVMIENAHKHLEYWAHDHPDEKLEGEARWKVIGDSAAEVGPALFFSLLIITLSFIPVFTLEAQEGRLFSPLAFTKTYAMAAAAGLSVTLIPVLMGYLIRGRIPDEKTNPLNRFLIAAYRPLLNLVCCAGRRSRWASRRHCWSSASGRCNTSAASSCPSWTKATCCTCHRPCLACLPARLRTAAADRPADQDSARGRQRLRQGRPRRDRDRSGAAGDVRDHHPVQAQGPVARRHDRRQAGRGTGPHRQGAGPGQHLGAADPQPHRHAGDRHQEPGGREGGRHRPGGDRPPQLARSSGCSRTCRA
jgi:hypothetical protein